MIAYNQWQAFKTVLENEGKTISATLVAFIEGYLAAVRSPELSSQEINTRLQHLLRHKTDHWEQKVLTLQHRVLRTEAGLEQLNFAVELLQRERAARPVELEVMEVTPEVRPLDPHTVIPETERVDQTSRHPGSVADVRAADVTNVPAPEDFAPEGLTLINLCRAFDIKPQNLDRHANLRGMTLENYLYLLTGWSYRQGRYYPP